MNELNSGGLLADVFALGQVLLIDLVLAGDNAIVVGLVAATIPERQRLSVISWGIAAAVGLRILFAVLATYLLAIIGLTFAGGLLLLWVCWKLYRDLSKQKHEESVVSGTVAEKDAASCSEELSRRRLWTAIGRIVLADVSMSLDNVLAVAGVARDHVEILVVGLLLSVVLMGVAASFVARLLNRYHWIAYVGLAVIAYVAVSMVWIGGHELFVASRIAS
ncbi:TerC family protein [Azospirillaceae bacterium]